MAQCDDTESNHVFVHGYPCGPVQTKHFTIPGTGLLDGLLQYFSVEITCRTQHLVQDTSGPVESSSSGRWTTANITFSDCATREDRRFHAAPLVAVMHSEGGRGEHWFYQAAALLVTLAICLQVRTEQINARRLTQRLEVDCLSRTNVPYSM